MSSKNSSVEGKPDISKLSDPMNVPAANIVDTVKPGEYPAAGHVYRIDFGLFSGTLDFHSENKMTFNVDIKGGPQGVKETVDIFVTKIRDNIFMVHWVEKSGSLVHVQDFENGVVYTNAQPPNGKMMRLKGTLTKVK